MVLSTIIFIFFACLMPALAFGAIYDFVTDGQIGVTESLMATGICGIIKYARQPGRARLLGQALAGALLLLTRRMQMPEFRTPKR